VWFNKLQDLGYFYPSRPMMTQVGASQVASGIATEFVEELGEMKYPATLVLSVSRCQLSNGVYLMCSCLAASIFRPSVTIVPRCSISRRKSSSRSSRLYELQEALPLGVRKALTT
jgi:hypothetical protein